MAEKNASDTDINDAVKEVIGKIADKARNLTDGDLPANPQELAWFIEFWGDECNRFK